MRTKSITLVVCILALAAATIQGLAQGPQQEQRRETLQSVVTAVGPQTVQAQFGGDGYVFVASEMSFDRKLVKGAPYSAVAVTESIQTLSDGNRLVRKSSASIYRDSEGRTRREQVLAKIGPYASAGDTPQTIFINDPVAQVNYILEPASRTARKIGMPNVVLRTALDEEKIRARESMATRATSPGEREKFEVEVRAASGVGASAAGATSISVYQGGKVSKFVKSA